MKTFSQQKRHEASKALRTSSDTAVKPTHTPTPWKVEETFENSGDDCFVSVVGDNGTTEIFTQKDYGNKSRPIREDADFIVRAVNSHEALKQKVYEAYHTFLNGCKPEKWWFKEVEELLAQVEEK